MVDTISTSFPVANVSIPASPANGNTVEGGNSAPSPNSVPIRTDQVNLSPEAQIAARQVFSERPDINTSQEQAIQISDASDAVLEQVESFVSPQSDNSSGNSSGNAAITIGTGSGGTGNPSAPVESETVTVPPPDVSNIGGNSTPEAEAFETETESSIGELVELR